MRRICRPLAFVAAAFTLVAPLAAQQKPTVESLERKIQALEDTQKALQKEVRQLRAILQGLAPARDVTVRLDGFPVRGRADAPVVMVEFSDFECPFCFRHFKETMPLIDKTYVQTGKIKYVFRDLPIESLHRNAFKAAQAAACAGDQGKYWEMHTRLFSNQKALAPADLAAHAQALGLDKAAFQQCLDSGTHADQVRQSVAEAGRAGASGTPTVFIGLAAPDGRTMKAIRLVTGAESFDRFKEAIEAVLAER